MSDTLNQFKDALVATIGTVWTDVTAAWEVQDLGTVAWDDPDLALPVAVVSPGKPQPAAIRPKNTFCWDWEWGIYWVGPFSGIIDPVRDRMQALERYLRKNRRIGGPAGGQRTKIALPEWGDDLDINVVLAQKNVAGARGGRLSVTYNVGEIGSGAAGAFDGLF